MRELRTRGGCRDVVLVGLRLGALVAARVARGPALSGRPTRLVLWQPVVRGGAYMFETLRAHVAGEMVLRRRAGGSRDALVARLRAGECVNVLGYAVSPAFFAEVSALDLATELVDAPPTLVVDVVNEARSRASPPLNATVLPSRAAADELATIAATVPRVAVVRATEPQSLHAEGRYFVNRADAVLAATAEFLADAP
jgi:hypothetical protein